MNASCYKCKIDKCEEQSKKQEEEEENVLKSLLISPVQLRVQLNSSVALVTQLQKEKREREGRMKWCKLHTLRVDAAFQIE